MDVNLGLEDVWEREGRKEGSRPVLSRPFVCLPVCLSRHSV